MSFVKKHIFVLFLILISVIEFLRNYIPGTYLIGWDNLMPEFDIKVNFSRALFGVWQEYRGLGIMDGMGNTANLMHNVYIFLLSILFPQNMLRYLFIYGTHFAGGLGFYLLLTHLTKNRKAAFIGALFYMFNLGVVQMYFAPLEVFAIHFAALPFLAWLIIKAQEKTSKKNLLFLLLGAILFSPQGFVPTVFFAFVIFVTFLLATDLLRTKNIKKTLIIGAVLFAANAFWMLPYLYTGPHTAPLIENAKINEFSSEEIFYRNQARGDLLSVMQMQGFMIDTIEYDNNSNSDVIFMQQWRTFQASIIYKLLYLVVILLAGYGLIFGLRKQKYLVLPYTLSLGVAFFFLANDTPILMNLNDLFRNIFPALGEAFRFPFTKFITLFAFCLSVLFTFGLTAFASNYKKYAKASFVVTIIAVLYFSLPAFEGQFTSSLLRVPVPKEYLQTFDYFQHQNPHARVALLPVHTFWNWQYRLWGQRGSGFLWYGLPQADLERAFDPWNNYDEQEYNEMATAINAENKQALQNVLGKYDISYLLLDKYLLNTLTREPINYDSLNKFLGSCNFLQKEEDYGRISIYSVKPNPTWMYSLNSKAITKVAPNLSYEKTDLISENSGNYVVSANSNVSYLFPSFFTEKSQEDLDFHAVNNASDNITFTPKSLPIATGNNLQMHIPSLFASDFLVPITVTMENGIITLSPTYPKIYVNNKQIPINDTPITVVPKVIKDPTTIVFEDTKDTLNMSKKVNNSFLLNNYNNTIQLQNGRSKELISIDTHHSSLPSFTVDLPSHITSIKVVMDKIHSPLAAEKVIESGKYQTTVVPSIINPYGSSLGKVTKTKQTVSFTVQSTSAELSFYQPNLYHEASYILFAKTQYNSGLPISFYADNTYEKRAEVESIFSKNVNQSVVVISPTQAYFQGYGFHFTVKSIGKELASSSISDINIYPFPEYFLRGITISPKSTQTASSSTNKIPQEFIEPHSFVYATSTTPYGDTYLTLSQSFNSAWQAYAVPNNSFFNLYLPFLTGKYLDNHVIVNDWTNGWLIPSLPAGDSVVIIFWPQYLEFIGFGMLVVAIVLLIYNPKLRRKR